MTDIISINVTSLKVIRSEATISLEHAARHFETFIGDTNNVDALKETLSSLNDLKGVYTLLELPGALDLVTMMVKVSEALITSEIKPSQFNLSALSHAYVGLPCYIEYVADREQAIPALILPFINELNAALRQPLILESQLASFHAEAIVLTSSSAVADDLIALVPRQRQMFQLGLIGLLREENLEIKIQLMHRAMRRLAQASGSLAIHTLWRLAEAVLEGFVNGELQLNFTRKRTLSQLDAALRQFIANDCDGAIPVSHELLTELLYLVSMIEKPGDVVLQVLEQTGLVAPEFSDQALNKERDIMQGPNAETIITMVGAIREELAQTKEVLEIAAQDASGGTDLSPLTGLFQRSADILSVVGLLSESNILSGLLQQVQTWINAGNYDRDQLSNIADGLLYVESSLSNLSRLDLNFSSKDESEESKRALMAQSQLDQAQTIVLQEAQAGIILAKKDISSFIESNFDMLHIANISETLISVRGGVAVLGYQRATAILNSCATFIEDIQERGLGSDRAEDVLETMADALISLEYYLSEIELHGVAPPNVLEVAEKSLAALGFPVTAA